MDSSTFQAQVLPVLTDCGKLITEASKELKGSNAIVLIETEGLYPNLLYAFNKLARKLPAGKGIDLIIDSLGGNIDTASAIAALCRERFGSLRVIVPFMAKSAATLIALAANERFLTSSAQLGPVDPQVRHPEKKGMWFPAHSIKEALEQVQATQDPIVKMAMADKLDPFLIGAYQDAISAAKQYIEEVVEAWGLPNKEEVVSVFIDRFRSHGYPIGCSALRTVNVPYTPLATKAEEIVCELHEKCVDLLNEHVDVTIETGAIILSQDEYLVRFANFKESGKYPATTAPIAVPAVPVPAASAQTAS